jgi:hypothetical protein
VDTRADQLEISYSLESQEPNYDDSSVRCVVDAELLIRSIVEEFAGFGYQISSPFELVEDIEVQLDSKFGVELPRSVIENSVDIWKNLVAA